MRYKISTVYTPNDPMYDRRRKATCFDHDGDLRSAGEAGLKALGFEAELINDAMSVLSRGILDIDPDNTAPTFVVHSSDGEYEITVEEWESEDPVTPERLRQWARQRAKAAKCAIPEDILADVLGRQCWVQLENTKQFDLKEAFHELYMCGSTVKGYSNMTVNELVQAVMNEVVEGQQDNYPEDAVEPWGFEAMIKSNKGIWLDAN